MRTYPLVVPAGKTIQFSVSGDFVHVRDAAGEVHIAASSGDAVDLYEGDGASMRAFSYLSISHDFAIAITIVIAVGTGERAFGGNGVKRGGSTPTIQNVLMTNDANNPVLITIPAGARKFTLRSRTTNVYGIYVAFAGNPMSANPYAFLLPGETWSEDNLLIPPAGIVAYCYGQGVTDTVEVISWQ